MDYQNLKNPILIEANRFSRFEVYWIQADVREAKYIYRYINQYHIRRGSNSLNSDSCIISHIQCLKKRGIRVYRLVCNHSNFRLVNLKITIL